MRISRPEKIVTYVILGLFALFSITPLIGVLLSSLTPSAQNDGGFHIPDSLAFGNYGAAWHEGHFSTYMLSSVIVTVCVVVLTGVIGILAGYAFARMDFIGSSVIFYVLLAGMMLPAEAFIIPLYFNLRGIGLIDSYPSLILPQTAQSLGFAIFWSRNQFRTFPGEIIEAARIDGCSDMRLLWRVIVPSSIAPLMTMALLVTMWTWNEFLLPLVLISGESRRTALLGLAFFQDQHLTDYSLLGAAGVLVALSIVVLYLFLQKKFISGMLGGVATK
jgi:raffinose/stachyose/melibiose transport system permease protein